MGYIIIDGSSLPQAYTTVGVGGSGLCRWGWLLEGTYCGLQPDRRRLDLVGEPLLPVVERGLVRNIVELRDTDRFVFLVGSPLIALLQGVLIFTICKFRLYRSSPLDIILLCFISELILNLSFLANSSTPTLTKSIIPSFRRLVLCLDPSRRSVW
jgi:hypothetical protein